MASRIRLLALDVDGVLTNGDLVYGPDGEILKTFNVKDGHGLRRLVMSGIEVCIITARKTQALETRVQDLGIKYCFQGIKDKLAVLDEVLEREKLTYPQVAYMGDDEPDMPILRRVGLSACPLDAWDKVVDICTWRSSRKGGKGAVREFCEFILSAAKSDV